MLVVESFVVAGVFVVEALVVESSWFLVVTGIVTFRRVMRYSEPTGLASRCICLKSEI